MTMRALLPAAGLGTRMAHLTDGGSKELLMVGGRPIIARVIQEARESGADEVLVISSPRKADLNAYLEANSVPYVLQEEPIGLGPAAALGLSDQATLVLLPDSFFFPLSPASRLAQALAEGCEVAIAFREAPDHLVNRYGIAVEKEGRLAGLVEKPALLDAPSRWAVNGRYAFSGGASLWLKAWIEARLPAAGEKELPLTPAIQAFLSAGHQGAMIRALEGETRHDCGSPEGYLEAKELFS